VAQRSLCHRTFGLLTGRKAEAFAQTELAFVLSQSSIASARLARQIALAVEVSDLNEQALVANRLKSEFFTTISHELRTPLNAILGYTELMVAGRYGPLSDQQQDRLGRVFENAQHLLALIDDVLALSRIEAGKMKPDLQVQDIAPFIRAAVGRITSEAEQKQLSVTLILADSLPSVLVDSEQIRQIMTNLLNNAVKFTHKGSIRIQVRELSMIASKVSREPAPPVLPAGNWLVVSVQDTGIGIAPENLDIIFDSFRQVDGSAARQFEGTGLGLAIARQFAELHGGKLWVESEVGHGSTFTLALPIIEDTEETS
jgi:signal transduction histidine kinase